MDDTRIAEPPRWARIAGTVGWVAPVLGFVPLHLPWLLGIPWLAHPASFHTWYAGDRMLGLPGGGVYLGVLELLALLGGVLALGLIRPWGLTYPRWVPLLARRRVPPWFPLTPAVLGSVLLIGYALTLPVQFPRSIAAASPADPFTITGALIGLPVFLAWTVALPLAAWSYYRRTRSSARRRPPATPRRRGSGIVPGWPGSRLGRG